MRELSVEETEAASGGLVPAVWGAFVAYNYITAAYTTTQIAYAAGVAAGAAVAVAAATN